MSPIAIALLYAVGVALVLTELLTPGIVIGLLGSACLGTAVYFTFVEYGVAVGLLSLGAAVLFGVAVVLYAVRRLTLRSTLESTDGYDSADPQLKELVGVEGVTLTPLHPTGLARLSGRRLSVVSRGEPVEAEVRVKVIEVEGNRIVVKPV